jgi:hypothetical protein
MCDHDAVPVNGGAVRSSLELCEVVDEPLEGVHLVLPHDPVEVQELLCDKQHRGHSREVTQA